MFAATNLDYKLVSKAINQIALINCKTHLQMFDPSMLVGCWDLRNFRCLQCLISHPGSLHLSVIRRSIVQFWFVLLTTESGEKR